MKCLNDVRVCAGNNNGFFGINYCHKVEYVGWKNFTNNGIYEENIDPKYHYHIQYCNHERLNKIVVGGQVVYECALIDENEELFNVILEDLDKGSRDVMWVEHSSYRINNR